MKNETLELISGLGTGGSLGLFHQVQMLELMQKAGVYDKIGTVDANLTEYFKYISATSLGFFALALGGFYVGSKIPKLYRKYFKQK